MGQSHSPYRTSTVAPTSPSVPVPRAPTDDPTAADGELIVTAAAVVRRRCRHGCYRGLTARTADMMVNALVGIAGEMVSRPPDEIAEATALTHRILDDDHPDHTALWQRLIAGGPDEVAGPGRRATSGK